MITLTPTQRRSLRASAHGLKPVVSIAAKGLTPAVLAEIDRALNAHALIKVRIHGQERATRSAWLEEICAALLCAPVQQIGNILVLWRPLPQDSSERLPAPTRPRRVRQTKKQAAAAWERKHQNA